MMAVVEIVQQECTLVDGCCVGGAAHSYARQRLCFFAEIGALCNEQVRLETQLKGNTRGVRKCNASVELNRHSRRKACRGAHSRCTVRVSRVEA